MDERLNDIESENLNCVVCLQEKIEIEQVCYTNCNHNFCKGCLQDWFDRAKNTCPLCRTQLKSYMNQNQETKLITIENITPQTIENVTINGRPVRSVISELINNNIRLRYMIYMLGLSGILLLTFYLGLKNDYEELLRNFNSCHNNYTELLNDNLDINNMLNDHKIVGIIYDSNHYKLCTIPKLYYRPFEKVL